MDSPHRDESATLRSRIAELTEENARLAEQVRQAPVVASRWPYDWVEWVLVAFLVPLPASIVGFLFAVFAH